MTITRIRISLSTRIAAIGAAGVLGLCIVGGIYLFGAAAQSQYQQVADDAAAISALTRNLVIEMLEARRAEKDFQLRSESKYVESQQRFARKAADSLAALKARLLAAAETNLVARVDGVASGFARYAENFAALAAARRTLGLDQDSGLEGTLRKSVHAIEERLKPIEDARFRAAMLTMRRHEKDFMLRRDARYGEEFKRSVAEFSALLGAAKLDTAGTADIKLKLDAYERDFAAWIEGAQAVAQARRIMSETYAAIEPEIEAVYRATEKVSRDADAANAEVRTATRGRIQIAMVVVFLGVGALGLLIGRSISRPLIAMTAAMRELAGGNLEIVVPGSGRNDEIGEMAGAVGVFRTNAVERLKLEAEAKEAEARQLERRQADMRRLAGEFEAAVGNIIQSVSSASSQLEAAAGTLTATAATTQQRSGSVAAASEQASANVQSVASATEELGASIHEISRQVQESSRIAGAAVKQAEKTDVRITELTQAAGRIGDVVQLITAIAEQTNLLALNATIEAARAGAAGRGFAVVASEVKALAAQTAKATDEIGTQISGMQTATRESVNAIKEIGTTINRISEIAATIASAVEEQGAATQEITRNVQQAAQGTNEVASSIGDVNRGATETGSASAQVLASARSLSGESQHLKEEVHKFLAGVRGG